MASESYTVDGSTTIEMEQLFISTMDKRMKSIIDQIFSANVALAWMLSRKNTDLIGDGGKQFIVPLEVAENPNGGWIDVEEGISMDDYNPVDAAIYEGKDCAYNLRLGRYQQRVNRGSSKIFSLLQMKEENTVKTMRKLMEIGLWTGNGTDKVMNGLPLLVPATEPASQTTKIGDISPSTKTWWRSLAINMSGIPAAAKLEARMLDLWDDIGLEGGNVDVIFTDTGTKKTYEKNQMDFISTGFVKIADFNFEAVKYKSAPIAVSKYATVGQLRMIDSSGIVFCVNPAAWFQWTAWKEQVNVPITKHRQLLSNVQLARKEARVTGCIYNITAA